MREPKGRKEMKTWTVEELRAFLALVEEDRNFPLYRLAAYSGMRRGELLGLRWEDVKFHVGSVSVQQQLGMVEDEEDDDGTTEDDAIPIFVPVKTEAGRRSIRLDQITLGVLREHRAAQEVERRRAGDAYHDHDLVFCRPDGAAQDPDTISGQFERLVRRWRLKRIRFHDLRHTHATLLLEAHVDVTVVSRRLGHANVQITADRYAHVTAKLQYDAAERFSALVDGLPPPPASPDHPGPAGGADC
jgi:integrase